MERKAAEVGLRTAGPVIAVRAPVIVVAVAAAGIVIRDPDPGNDDETENEAEAAIARGARAVTARGAEATKDDADHDPGHVTVADPVLHAEDLRKKFANVHLRF